MNAILHVPVGLCRDRRLSAVSREPSAYGRSLEGLKPKTQYLKPESQRSVYGRRLQALLALKPNTQYLKSVRSALGCRPLSALSYEQSAVSRARSVVSRSLQGLKPNTQYLIPFIIFIFVSCDAAMAQESLPAPAAEAVAEIAPLEVGDRVPEQLWDMSFPVVSAESDQVQYLSLGNFRDKLIILDFWSTWCGSCIYAFPNNYALANEFADDLLLMPVGINSEADVRKFMATHKNGKFLPQSILDKEILKQYFPHRFIPHYVWIHEGKLISVTDSDQLISAHVRDVLKGAGIAVRQKNDVFDFDIRDPFDKNWESLFEGQVVAKTTLTEFIDGIGSWVGGAYNSDSSVYRHSSVNRPLTGIYNLAVKKPMNHFMNEASDKSLFEDNGKDPDWFRKNTYCYEYLVPRGMGEERIGEIIVNDLNTKANLNSRLERRMMDCYVMVYDEDGIEGNGVPGDDEARMKGLDEIALSFNNRRKYDRHSYQSPPILINEAVSGKSFVPPPVGIIDIESFNAFMKPQGVTAVPARREIEVFVLSDSK